MSKATQPKRHRSVVHGAAGLGMATFAWRWRSALAAAMVIAALNGMLIWMLYEGRSAVRQTAVQSATSLAAALERDIARSIELYDLSLQAVQDGLRLPGIADFSPELRALILFDRAATANNLGSISVFNAEGDLIASSTQGSPAGGGRSCHSEVLQNPS